MSPRTPRRLLACTIVALALLGGACGDDDDTAGDVTTSSTTTDPSATSVVDEPGDAPDDGNDGNGGNDGNDAFCAAVEELNNTNGPPTIEQMEAYAEVAPDEAQAHVTTILDVVRANDGNFMAAVTDPEAAAALEDLVVVEEAACGPSDDGSDQDPSVTQVDPAATRVDVSTRDYTFEFDAPTSAGRYSFVSTNEGEEAHLMILLRLEEGATLDQALASQGEEGVVEAFESDLAVPGSEMVISADLGPGEWVLLCPIPDADGTSHVEHGMIEEFELT